MQTPEPILVVDLFPLERAALLDLLESLNPVAWERATVCTGWAVRDIAAHLVGDHRVTQCVRIVRTARRCGPRWCPCTVSVVPRNGQTGSSQVPNHNGYSGLAGTGVSCPVAVLKDRSQ
jgi:hypothetical protein